MKQRHSNNYLSKCISLTFLAVWSITAAFAQLGNRDVNGKTYGERDMERTANNTAKPNSPLVKWAFDQKAIDNYLEAIRKQNEKNRQHQTQEQLAKVDSLWAAQDKVKVNTKIAQSRKEFPIRWMFITAGFGSGIESAGLIESITMSTDSVQINMAFEMMKAKKVFTIANQTEPFDFLAGLVMTYTPMFETALLDLSALEKRFPQKIGAIDTLRLVAISYGFGRTYPGSKPKINSWCCDHYAPTYETYNNGIPSAQEYVRITNLSLFEKLADKYPAFASEMAATASVVSVNDFSKKSPYVQLAIKYSGREFESHNKIKNLELWKKYCLKAMHTSYPKEEYGLISIRLQGLVFTDGKAFLKLVKSIPTEEWVEIANAQGLNSPKDIAILFHGELLYPIQKEIQKELIKISKTL